MKWDKIKFGDVVGKVGLFSDGDWIESKDQDVNGSVRLIQMADIGINVYKNKSSRFLTEQKFSDLKCTEVKKGDILISRMPDPIGRACIFPGDIKKCVTVVDIAIVRPDSKLVDSKWLTYLINSAEVRSVIEKLATGSTRKRISGKNLKNILISLPQLETQRHIANILDQADALRQKTEKIITNYDQLAQSIFLDMFGDPVTNPKGWEIVQLGDVCSKIGSGSTPRGGKESYINEGISLIRSLNVHDGVFKYKDLAHITSDQALKLKNVIIDKNDVLLNITGASVCRCAIVPDDILPARVNQHVSILRVKCGIYDASFLARLLISSNVKKQLLKLATNGGATREALTKDDIQSFDVIAPPLTHQIQFAERIANIKKQKELAIQSLKEADDLFNALLQKAFKGELLPSENRLCLSENA